MAELNLRAHEAALEDLVDKELVSDERLDWHITDIEEQHKEALQAGLGRQAEHAARILAQFRFEQSMRASDLVVPDFAPDEVPATVNVQRVHSK